MKTLQEKYRQKLIEMCEKAPEYLTRECHRLLHDGDEEGYKVRIADFIEEIHLIVGKNVGHLCAEWATQILKHKEMKPNEP